MDSVKKYFSEGLDADSDPLMVGDGAYINAENINFGTTETGKTERIEWVIGNILADNFDSLPAGTNETVASIADEANNRIIFFNYNSLGNHGIYVIYTNNAGLYTVLLNSQVAGGLGITRYNQIHSLFLAGNLLYWTNGAENPFRINVVAGINLNHPVQDPTILPYSVPTGGIPKTVLTVIRKPPIYPVLATKIDSTTTAFTNNANLIQGESLLFCMRYTYRDGEQSTVSYRSILIPFDANGVTNLDGVLLKMDLLEKIGQDVQVVEMIATFLNTGKSYVIKTWNRAVASEATEISQHNTSTLPLTFYFFNTHVLYPVDDAAMVKAYDVVPLTSQTCATAKNRGFWGNNLLGYDTPKLSSLTLAPKLANVLGTDAKWEYFFLTYENATFFGSGTTSTFLLYAYVLYVPVSTATVAAGYYRYVDAITVITPEPAFATTISPGTFATYVYMGIDRYAAALYLFAAYGGTTVRTIVNADSPRGDTIITNADFTYPYILKTDSSVAAGVVFFDAYMRQCGVVQNGRFSRITTADRTYAAVDINYGIGWTLSNTNALTEIPDWAVYVGIVASKTKRTNFFVQSKSATVRYFAKDASGNYDTTATTFAAGQFGIGVKLDILNTNNNGYAYQEGDIIKIWKSTGGAAIVLSVKDTFADWVIADLQDIGSTVALTVLFELYSPTPVGTPENFYEQAQIFPITDAGLSTRRYSVLSGIIPGDVFIIEKAYLGNYFVEAMSPNDKYWKRWFTNRGRVQIVDNIGQQRRRTNISFSNVYIDGSKVNGLSSFDALNSQDLPIEMGDIQRLAQVNKVSEDGNILLSVNTDEAAAIYIGETQISDNRSSQFLSQSTGVIGTINVLRGGHGTINPESLVIAEGLAFWVNLKDGSWVQYSNNGADSISKYKLTKWSKRYADRFMELGKQSIINTGQRPFIIGGYNSYHGQVVWSVPFVEITAPYGTLADSNSMEYPFDFYDKKAKTIVFNKDRNMWMGSQLYVADSSATVGQTMYSFKGGKPYAHKATANTATFYGVQTKARLMYVCRKMPNVVKAWRTAAIESSRQPDYTYFRTELPYVQGSDLISTDYKNREGIFYASMFRDRLTPGFGTAYDTAGQRGDTIRGMYLLVLLEWTPSGTERGYLRFVNHGYIDSKGHTV